MLLDSHTALWLLVYFEFPCLFSSLNHTMLFKVYVLNNVFVKIITIVVYNTKTMFEEILQIYKVL